MSEWKKLGDGDPLADIRELSARIFNTSVFSARWAFLPPPPNWRAIDRDRCLAVAEQVARDSAVKAVRVVIYDVGDTCQLEAASFEWVPAAGTRDADAYAIAIGRPDARVYWLTRTRAA